MLLSNRRKNEMSKRQFKFIGFIVLMIVLNSCHMNKQIMKEKEKVLSNAKRETKIVNENNIVHLPLLVQKWLKNSGIIGKEAIHTVRLNQIARIRTKPEQKKWYKAKANQLITTDPPAFIWTVKMNIKKIFSIKGRDKFVDGKGNMLMKLNSLFTLGNESGEKIDEGTIQRFLAEMVWYPSFATSNYVRWEAIDDCSVRATMTYKGTKGNGIFYFNDQGDIEKFSTLRYKGNEEDKRYEWIVKIKKYSVFNSIKIPSHMEAIWVLDSGCWKWLDLKITEYEFGKRCS